MVQNILLAFFDTHAKKCMYIADSDGPIALKLPNLLPKLATGPEYLILLLMTDYNHGKFKCVKPDTHDETFYMKLLYKICCIMIHNCTDDGTFV